MTSIQQAMGLQRQGRLADAEKAYRSILAQHPSHFDALHSLGVLKAQQGRFQEALEFMSAALKQKPDSTDALINYGAILSALNRHEEALACCERLLRLDPRNVDVLFNKAVMLTQLGRGEAAVSVYNQLLMLSVNNVHVLFNRANLLAQFFERHEDALADYDQVLAIAPGEIGAIVNRGIVLMKLRRFEEALGCFERVLKIAPANLDALNNRASVLKTLGRFDEALAACNKALAINPDHVDALITRGNILYEIKQFQDALASYDRALTLRPDDAEAYNSRGLALCELKRFGDALENFDRALIVRSNYAEAHNNRGSALKELGRRDEAFASYNRALTLRAEYADAHYGLGSLFLETRQFDKAFACFDRALAIQPDLKFAPGQRLHTKMLLCDWRDLDKECETLSAAVQADSPVSLPFAMLGVSTSLNNYFRCAQIFAADRNFVSTMPLWQGGTYKHDRIRVAYVSADFREHPVAALLAAVFECHDRARFETVAISFGPDDGSKMRARLQGSFERFIDVRDKIDADAARLIRELEIDIAVDLMGYTADCRPGILVHRPAPIQVSYLGFPGTSGSNFIDYFLGDRIVLPFDRQPIYMEKIVHLPDCFMPTGSRPSVASDLPRRGAVGLPERAFVFCSFNESYKITAPMFDIWMRLLRNVEGSVLWLIGSNDTAMANLRREAQARGVAGHRLIFAPRIGRVEHLARIASADLFLNTHPVNAGATAVDALSVGLPIVSYMGEAFVQRVTASLLHGIGLPEMVTDTLADYEALALKLAREPALLAEVKAKLARNRDSYPLFDTDRFARHIEAAYTTMQAIWERGEAPRSFSVEPTACSGQRDKP